MIEISREQAQRFITNAQLLNKNPIIDNVVDIAKRIHNVQIDTISVVARSHDLILFNRYPKYKEKDVWKAVEERKLFEYWSHALCLMPIEEFPFYLWKMNYKTENPETYWKKWIVDNKKVVEDIYTHIRKNGPTCSSDFKREEKSKVIGWWNWKKEKSAMEYLFNQGKLMITYRKGFKRYYELTENVLPASIHSEPLPKEDLAEHLIRVIFSSLGIASAEELKTYLGRAYTTILWNNSKKKIVEFLNECIEIDLLTKVKIDDIQPSHFVLTDHIKDLDQTIIPDNDDKTMKFLSPFDNLVRERDYPERFWNFVYKIESYTPQAQRIYGYYSLPILDGHQLIGRTDLKVHRKDAKLEIKSLHFESGIKLDDDLLNRFKDGIHKLADFHNCQEFIYENIQPIKYKGKIKTLFS
ncbi:MAG: winged helix-turn-helix domain-containing protein [Candidatus Heimdallarchaeota archaeon]